jgi:hypothetical protein
MVFGAALVAAAAGYGASGLIKSPSGRPMHHAIPVQANLLPSVQSGGGEYTGSGPGSPESAFIYLVSGNVEHSQGDDTIAVQEYVFALQADPAAEKFIPPTLLQRVLHALP